jgi:NADH:ubiquinone oxidoreductase subunit H
VFFSGYFSKSKYSFLGRIRSAAQSVSFEVRFFFMVLSYIFFNKNFQFSISFRALLFPLAFLWFITMVVELGRAPADFSERESELVRGYNLEYGGIFFIFLFIREYGFLLFFSSLYSQIFLAWSGIPSISIYLVFTVLLILRASLPRYRYDLLIGFF